MTARQPGKNTLNQMFNEYFYIGSLPEPLRKKYQLIERYQDKVSDRLLQEADDLYNQGKKLFTDIFLEELQKPSPFVQKLSQQSIDIWHRPCIIPIKYGEENG